MNNQQRYPEDNKNDEENDDCSDDKEDEDIMFDLICKSPPQSERIRKRESKKFKPHNPKQPATEQNEAIESNATSEPIIISPNVQKREKYKMKLTFGPQKTSTISNTESSSYQYHHRQQQQLPKQQITRPKSLTRVKSLPLFTGTHLKELIKSINIAHRSTLFSESSDGKNETIYDIDDDLINCFHEQNIANDNEYEKRVNFYEKFTLILKFMLKPTTHSLDYYRTNSIDIGTPSTPTITTPHPILPLPPPSSQRQLNDLPSYIYDYYYVYNNNQQPSSEQLAAHSNENLWYNLYDYFVNYNKRSKTLEEIKENLNNTRSKYVQATINYILNLDLSIIGNQMQYDLKSGKLYNASDYRRLNESPKYICKLSYLYCYIEDILNRVGYIESLYPSLKALEKEESLYASEDFQNRIKTLLLWYNIMTDLMRQCDLFGRFLGFTKRESYHKLWTWFDKNQNYSLRDYEKIQLSLLNHSKAFDAPQTAPILKSSRSTSNSFLKPQISVSMPKSSTFEPLSSIVSTKVFQTSKPPKLQRQVSFELNASKPTKNLIYSSFDDSVILNSPNPILSRQNSGRASFGAGDNINLAASPAPGSATPLPQKLQNFFSFHSSASSRKSNDSVPTSLYASLIHDSFDEQNDDDSFEKKIDNATELKEQSQTEEAAKANSIQQIEITREKIYEDFINKRLCKQGLAETCKQIFNMIGNTLPRASSALETIFETKTASKTKSSTLEFFTYHWMPLHTKCRDYISKYNNDVETKQYSINSQQFKDLYLPTFRPLYLFLINCILDLMNICMKMYIDMYTRAHTDNSFSFSLLSTEQLTKECRECIEHGILVRQYYHYMIFTVFTKEELEKNPIENELEKFDNDLKELINIYLKYVENWVSDTLKLNSLSLNVLEKEWNFCKNNLCYVSIGEDSYAKSFCTINCNIIKSLSNLNEIDIIKQSLIDSLDDSLMNNQDSSSDNYVDYETRSSNLVANSMFDIGGAENDNDTNEDNEVNFKCNELKLQIRELRDRTMKALTFCRSFINDLELAAKYEVKNNLKTLLESLRTEFRLIKLTGNKIDDNSSFMIFVPKDFGDDKKKILRLLYMTSARDEGILNADDKKKTTTATSSNKMTSSLTYKKQSLCPSISSPMSISLTNKSTKGDMSTTLNYQQNRRSTTINIVENSSSDSQQNMQQLLVNEETTARASTLPNSPLIDNGNYLLYLSVSKKDQKNKEECTWRGFECRIEVSVDIKMRIFQHEPDDTKSYLYLVVGQPYYLSEKKVELKSKLKGNISLIKERTSFHPNIANELDELNTKILKNLRENAYEFIRSLETDTTQHFQQSLILSAQSASSNHNNSLIKKSLLDVWRVCYNYGIELHMECVKFVTQSLHRDFSIGLADFCKIWCKYVLDKTEQGYGRTTRPSWARKGFHLMNEVFKPQNSQHLTQKEFDELRNRVEGCIKHVIGTKREKPIAENDSFDLTDTTYKRNMRNLISYEKSVSLNEQNKIQEQKPNISSQLPHSQSSVVLRAQEFLQEQQIKTLLPPHKRCSIKCKERDESRTLALKECHLIGKTIERTENSFNMNEAKINVRRVDFRWQRGNKIGSGQSGIVYACVNLDTGEMMAMKEISYKPNDLQAIKSLADEIANIEGIKHENLVKFYGVELHKKEILIFMEFCANKYF